MINNRNFLDELKKFYTEIENKDFKKLYNLDFHLVRYANTVIARNKCVNRPNSDRKEPLSNIPKIDTIAKNKNKVGFAALLLCGGMSTRFMNEPKAIYRLNNLSNFKKYSSFLGLNILQIIKTEKILHCTIPVIIYDDFYTHDRIIAHLEENNFFGKCPADFYFVRQFTGLRYVPSKKFLLTNGFAGYLSRNEANDLPKRTKLFIAKNVKNTIISDGHFALNSLMKSGSFRLLIKNNPQIKYLVISNIDNLGQKYFPNLIKTNSSKNYILVCKRKNRERMDSVFTDSKRLIIEPYFIQNKTESNVGFTATSYIQLANLFRAFGYKSKQQYLTSRKNKKLHSKYRLVLKKLAINNLEAITVHFESSLAEIWRFLQLEAIEIDRAQFFPFKSLNDITPSYVESLKRSIIKYNYI